MQQKCIWWPGCARTYWGACSAPPDPLAELKGSGKREGEGVMEEEVKGRRKGENRTPIV